jgi:hypothetical protein
MLVVEVVRLTTEEPLELVELVVAVTVGLRLQQHQTMEALEE